ncbi:RES family NAD+ phosphorylase [Pseudoduganella sp. R-43]|uniref:RES family NAD+ phosphorylase n=1 Tax=Pseudoduganella sp. R-43 TaxID=3404063 RepID=UPI003CFB007E
MTLNDCNDHFYAITRSTNRDEIKSHLQLLLKEASILSFEQGQGEHYWRGVFAESEPFRPVSRITYAPPTMARINRMNDAGSPMVYCARSVNTVLAELRVQPGDYVQWFCFTRAPNKYLRLCVLGELKHVAQTGHTQMHGIDPKKTIRRLIAERGRDGARRLVYIDGLLSSLLAQSKSESKDYLTTRILAELALEQADSRGLTYRSFEDASGVNVALIPSIFESHTRIICCQHVRINKVHKGSSHRPNRYNYTLLHTATAIDDKHEFVWRQAGNLKELNLFNLTLRERDLIDGRKNGEGPFRFLNPD